MGEKQTTFGNFVEPGEGIIEGHLSLSFQHQRLNIDALWENSSLSAKFLSTFWGKFFPVHDPDSGPIKKQLEDAVHYVCAELLGNAVKFSYNPEYLIKICLYLHEQELRFYVTNSIRPDDVEHFKLFIKRILSEDTSAFFIEQMEKSAVHDNKESRIGFLTLINDYSVVLAWKFEEKVSGIQLVTTLARLPIMRNHNFS
ncbi:MAG: ATP-binding protein [Desulfobacterales bacterium]|nr:ATP-binding protein [Desulfobacterales bacterium]